MILLYRLSDAATLELENIKERSAVGLEYMVDQKSRLDIDISIMANNLIIPRNGHYKK